VDTYRVKGADGKIYKVRAPSPEAAASAVRTMLAADAAAAPAAPRRTGNDVGNTLRTLLGQGAGFGFGDEVEAGVRSLFSDRSYGDIRGDISDEIDAFRSRNPGLAYGSEIVGALGPTLAAAVATPFTGGGAGAGAAAGAGRIAMAGNKLRQLATPALRPVAQPIAKASKAVDAVLPTGPIKRAATVGAVQGGISGAGYAEGGLEDRAGGAAVGAGLGAAIPGLGAAVLPRLAPGAKEIINRGITLTPGQATGANSLTNRIEQLATSTLTGPGIAAARRRADAQYFPIAAREALEAAGQTLDTPATGKLSANEVMDQLVAGSRQAYDEAAAGLNVKDLGGQLIYGSAKDIIESLDGKVVKKIRKAVSDAAEELSDGKGAKVRAAFDAISTGKPVPVFDLSGQDLLKIKNKLRKKARNALGVKENQLYNALEMLQRNIIDNAGRVSGAGAAAVRNADTLFRETKGVFAPAFQRTGYDEAPRITGIAAARQKNLQKFGSNDAIEARLPDDAQLATMTANTTPNSGTIDRGTLMMLLNNIGRVGGAGASFAISPSLLLAQLAGVPYMTPQTTAALRQGLLAPGRITQALGGRFGGMIGGANAQE